MNRLENKAALVTGGGKGIGWATALLFAREGAEVGIIAKSPESIDKIEKVGKEIGIAFRTFLGDVSKKDQVEAAVEGFVEATGRIDILVKNAGMVMPKPFLEKSVEEWVRVFEVNLLGVFLCSQAAARHMLKQKSGKIVNISSIRAVEHCGRESVMDYSAAKAGVVNMTKTMAKELAPDITVNAVAPGHTNTDLLKGLPEEVRRNMLAGTYLGRFAEPEDIAHAVLFLSSSEADFITGHHLVVDGGFSLKQG